MLTAVLMAWAMGGAIPALEETQERIAQRDTELFREAFGGCDVDHLRTMIDDEFRMLHDQGGLIFDNADAFLKMIEDDCSARDPNVYANRRDHVEGSRKVQRLGDWGALEEGLHTFSESQQGGPFQTVGRARYIHTWRWDGEGFVLVESLSVDHEAYSGD